MDFAAGIVGALFAGVAYIYGYKTGHRAGAIAVHEAMKQAVIKFAFHNPGISEGRINELADSLIASDGDMHKQAVDHIRRAAQEAVGIAEEV